MYNTNTLFLKSAKFNVIGNQILALPNTIRSGKTLVKHTDTPIYDLVFIFYTFRNNVDKNI